MNSCKYNSIKDGLITEDGCRKRCLYTGGHTLWGLHFYCSFYVFLVVVPMSCHVRYIVFVLVLLS